MFKNLIKLSLVLSAIFFAQATFASAAYSMPAVEGGFRWSSAELDQASSNKQEIGFQVGGSVVIDFATNFGLKTGLFYVERPFRSDYSATSTEVKGKVSYFDVPAFVMFKLEDYAGYF